jgi:hypothetical protein
MALAQPGLRPLDWLPAPSAALRGARRRASPASPAARAAALLARLPWYDLAVHATLIGAAALLLYQALANGAVHWQDDTKYFYYPLLATVAAALKEGRLPLWEPGVFSGYPLFADGEAGMLYPPHLVALRWLDPPDALVALRLARFYLAGAFTYAFLRATGAGRTGALVAGLAFMLSGFMVGQVVHENLDSGMVWLPLTLCFVEQAVRAPFPRRYLWATFAGVALAMQALAVHVQVCLFTALVVCPYVVWRVLFRDAIRAPFLGRLVIGAGIGLVMGLVAAGLAAVQVLPLLDLADRSARGHGIGLAAATINSVTPFRLLTVLFPHLLSRPDGSSFGYWVSWDVTVYVGVPTLLLAALAVAVRRDRYTVFFAAVAGLALALAMGRYGPPWVVYVTQELLGEHGLRSPGRFAFLWSFGTAALAGWGVDWLARRAAAGTVAPGLRARLAHLWLGAVCLALGGVAAGLLVAVGTARQWLLSHPAACLAWVERQYLAFDRSVRLRATPDEVYRNLLAALDPGNPATQAWGLSVVAGFALLVLWVLAAPRRAASGRASVPAAAGHLALRGLTAGVVALPLLVAGTRAHPAAPVEAFAPRSDAVEYLRKQLAPPGVPAEQRPLYRVYTSQPIFLDRFDVEPNALLPLGIQEAGGYSSLSIEDNLAYAWAAETSQGRLLDVWNARYFVWPAAPASLPSHELTSFHPQRPLVAGTGGNAGAVASFRVPSVEGENVRVVATLRDAWAVPYGTVVAWITATTAGGEVRRWPLRMGMELADATRPMGAPEGAAPGTPWPMPVFSWKEPGPRDTAVDAHLYYVKLPLGTPQSIVRLRVWSVPVAAAEQPILRVYGLGVGQPDWWVHNLTWFDRERFSLAYEGRDVRVYRNEAALPRAYLVPLAVQAPRHQHQKAMAERGFDPERMLLLDPRVATGSPSAGQVEGPSEPLGAGSWFRPRGDGPAAAPLVQVEDALGRVARSPSGRAVVGRYEGGLVRVQVEAAADAWLFLADTYDPGWRVYVDGEVRPMHLANATFRAVAVPAGQHLVEFRYEPASLRRGAALTLLTGLLVLAVTALSAVYAWRSGRA